MPLAGLKGVVCAKLRVEVFWGSTITVKT